LLLPIHFPLKRASRKCRIGGAEPADPAEVERLAGRRELLEEEGRGELLDREVESDWLEVALEDLRLRDGGREVGDVDDCFAAARVAAGERSRPGEVRVHERVDPDVAVPGKVGREVVVGRSARVWAALRAQRRAFDGEVDGAPQRRVVAEQGR